MYTKHVSTENSLPSSNADVIAGTASKALNCNLLSVDWLIFSHSVVTIAVGRVMFMSLKIKMAHRNLQASRHNVLISWLLSSET